MIFNNLEIMRVLEEFQIPAWQVRGAKHRFSTIRAERLTPDSSGVVLMIGEKYEKYYVLYSEDFIDTIGIVRRQIELFFPSKVLQFIRPMNPIKFDYSPNKQHYPQLDEKKIAEWEPFVFEDGNNFMLLAEVEPSDDNMCYWVASRRSIRG